MSEFDWTQHRVLIVDGDLDFLSWCDSTLREAGVAEVRCTMVGGDVANILREFPADAVVLDLEIEDGGGLEVLGQLRNEKTSAKPDVPVVLKADPSKAQKIRDACKIGLESLIRKPIEAQTFLNRISAAISNPRRLVAVPKYFGPDRRSDDEPFDGDERRQSAIEKPPRPGEPVAATRLTDEMRQALRNQDDDGDADQADTDLNLLQVLDDHLQWLESEGAKGKKATLSGKDLYGATLNRADLTRATLRRVILAAALCKKTNFQGADLSRSDLSEGDFSGADFGVAKLRFASLGKANLHGAHLRGTDLSGADLRGANLTVADLAGAILMDADLRGTDLHRSMGLTQDQLNRAIADETTRPPKGLRLPTNKG